MAKVEITRPAIETVVLTLSEEEAVAVAGAVGAAVAQGAHERVYKALVDQGLGYGHPRYDELQQKGGFR